MYTIELLRRHQSDRYKDNLHTEEAVIRILTWFVCHPKRTFYSIAIRKVADEPDT